MGTVSFTTLPAKIGHVTPDLIHVKHDLHKVNSRIAVLSRVILKRTGTQALMLGYPTEVGALFTTVSSIRVVGLALWLVSVIALNKYRYE